MTGRIRSLLILAVGIVGFVAMIVLTPRGQENAAVSISLFVGFLIVLKLLSQFEKPA